MWIIWIWDLDVNDYDMWDWYESRDDMQDALHSLRGDGCRCYAEKMPD